MRTEVKVLRTWIEETDRGLFLFWEVQYQRGPEIGKTIIVSQAVNHESTAI